MARLRRHCLTCGRITRSGSHCAACAPSRAAKYGGAHRRERERQIEALRRSEGVLCFRCGLVIHPQEKAIELDHLTAIVDGGLYGPKRLSHKKCNQKHGSDRGSRYVPPRKRT